MRVPLLDLKSQYAAIREEIQEAIGRVLESQRFVLGEEVERFERQVAEKFGVRHAIGVASGTDALLLSLKAVGVGPGDEVVTSAFTFFATAGTIWNLGARPVFADIEPSSFNLSPEEIGRRVTAKTKAIVPVHLFGQCARMGPILEFARDRGLAVIEDAAQAIGATHRLDSGAGGIQAGSYCAGTMGALGAVSFFPSKNLGGYGDGGMVLTQDDGLADRLRLLRVHGARPKYHHKIVGFNSRLDALQAAILSVKLSHLDDWSEARRRRARLYDELFAGSSVGTPAVEEGNTHIYHQYTIRVARRDALREHLASKGIGTEIYYPVPLHLQECFRGLGYREGDLPEAERAAKECLSLPVYPELSEEQQRYVADSVLEFVSGQ